MQIMMSLLEERCHQYNGMEAEDDDTELVKNGALMPALHWEDNNFQRQTMKSLNKSKQDVGGILSAVGCD